MIDNGGLLLGVFQIFIWCEDAVILRDKKDMDVCQLYWANVICLFILYVESWQMPPLEGYFHGVGMCSLKLAT
ncbi:MAG TPA: hypothetical protein ACQGQH_07540 [Xylella sp.]